MIKKIMIGGFWALVLLPNLLFPLVKGSGDSGSAENRTLAEFPVFQAKDFEAYPSEVDSYINDHAAFRNRFLSINSVLNLKLFGYADSQDVIRGKDGWYFFAGGMSLFDALGTEPFYQDDVAMIGNEIIRAANYYESRGIPFLMMIPPNKEGVYREYMPDCYGMGTAPPSWRNISGNIPVSRCWTPGSILTPTGITHGTIRQIPTGTLQGDMWAPR